MELLPETKCLKVNGCTGRVGAGVSEPVDPTDRVEANLKGAGDRKGDLSHAEPLRTVPAAKRLNAVFLASQP